MDRSIESGWGDDAFDEAAGEFESFFRRKIEGERGDVGCAH